jgi:SAM-dependent methyltransferase
MDSQYVSASEIAAGDLEDLQTCELCGSTALGHELAVGQWTLKRCRSCNIVFTSPRLNEVALNRHYKQGYYEGTAQYFSSQSTPVTADQRALVREVSRLIKSVTPSSLDIGCGGGQLVEAFADAGFSATGTEPSEAACDAAARLGRNVRNADLDSFANESFDCVTAVLEHVSHPRPFLAEVARITKLNGIVVIEVPNYGCKKRGGSAQSGCRSTRTPTCFTTHQRPSKTHFGITAWCRFACAVSAGLGCSQNMGRPCNRPRRRTPSLARADL